MKPSNFFFYSVLASTVLLIGLLAIEQTHSISCLNWVGSSHQPHLTHVDVAFGAHTKKELELFETFEPAPGLGTKTFPAKADGVHQNDILTIVIDFKDSSQGITQDIIGNNVGEFDVTEYGFAASQFDLVTEAILAEVQDDFFDELAGTVANQNGEILDIQFIDGDIGTPPPGISEFYYVQVGTGLDGPFTFALGVARGSAARNSSGTGPNNGAQNGDVIASVFTDNIQGLGGLTPSNALSSGNLELSRNAVVGTLSHEIGHVLSLSHINFAGSQQPTSGIAPIMGTGAIDLPNQQRITDREFSISGMNQQDGNASVFHISQLTGAVGLTDAIDPDIENLAINLLTGNSSGFLADIETSDGTALELTPTANPVSNVFLQFEIIANSPFLNPPGLVLDMESRANTPNIEQQIELFNFANGEFEVVNQSDLGLQFNTINVDLGATPGNYVDPTNCQIRARVIYTTTGPVVFFTWRVDIDQLKFAIEP